MKTSLLSIAAFCLTLVACVTEEKCNRLFPPSVTTTTDTQYVVVPVEIKGETVYETIKITDSLIIKELTESIVVRETDGGKAELRYWIDKYGNLVIECEAKDQIVELINKHITNNRIETRYKTPVWVWWTIGGLVALIALIVYSFIKLIQ